MRLKSILRQGGRRNSINLPREPSISTLEGDSLEAADHGRDRHLTAAREQKISLAITAPANAS